MDNQLTQPDRQCGFILYPHEYQQKSFFAIQRRKVGLKILVIIIFSFPFLKKRKKKERKNDFIFQHGVYTNIQIIKRDISYTLKQFFKTLKSTSFVLIKCKNNFRG